MQLDLVNGAKKTCCDGFLPRFCNIKDSCWSNKRAFAVGETFKCAVCPRRLFIAMACVCWVMRLKILEFDAKPGEDRPDDFVLPWVLDWPDILRDSRGFIGCFAAYLDTSFQPWKNLMRPPAPRRSDHVHFCRDTPSSIRCSGLVKHSEQELRILRGNDCEKVCLAKIAMLVGG